MQYDDEDGLTDNDMLELLLTMGTPRRDCKEVARELLQHFEGSLSRTLDASQVELEQVKGVGPKNAFALHFVQAAARRYLRGRLKGKHYLRLSRRGWCLPGPCHAGQKPGDFGGHFT